MSARAGRRLVRANVSRADELPPGPADVLAEAAASRAGRRSVVAA